VESGFALPCFHVISVITENYGGNENQKQAQLPIRWNNTSAKNSETQALVRRFSLFRSESRTSA
jgi:hypothetical protein